MPEVKITDQRMIDARLNLRMAMLLRDTDATSTAIKAGLSQNALGSFLRGDSVISYLNLLKVCEVLDIPIGILHLQKGITLLNIQGHKTLLELHDHDLEALLKAREVS